MMKPILVFTDGASRRNPGPGGWGAIVVDEARVVELGGGEPHTTNNRMELSAVIEALAFVSQTMLHDSSFTIQLFTDSSYVLNGATKWIHGWKNTGWKTKQKDDVLNKDLWEKLVPLLSMFKIEWVLLKGHRGISANERCDVIATTFADGKKLKLFDGKLSDYDVDLSVKVLPGASTSKSKAKKGTAFSYVSMLGGKVMAHKTWAECEKRVKGKSGAKFKKSFSKEDEAEIIASWQA